MAPRGVLRQAGRNRRCRVIGTGAFAPRDYLDRSVDANSVLEPGQSAQIAFRVREPAASTVAFTFEFL